jgi:hypothetical protein
VIAIQVQLEESTRELEALKQAHAVAPSPQPASPTSKRDLSAAKEELKGLKLVVLACVLVAIADL